MPVRRTRFAALAMGLAGVCLLSACGGGGASSSSGNGEAAKAGPQVVEDAAAALAAADAVHISGQVVDSSTGKSIDVDLQLQSNGTSGTLTLAGQPVNLISIGSATYLKTSAAFYAKEGVGSVAAAELANRWVKAPNSQDFTGITLSGLSKDLGVAHDGSRINDKVTTGMLKGHDVVIVSGSDGSKLYVAASGKPLPLKADRPAQSSSPGSLVFTGYGRHVEIKAPADAIDTTTGGAGV